MGAKAGTRTRLYGYVIRADCNVLDVRRGTSSANEDIYDSECLRAAQEFGRKIRDLGYNGLHATSVRRECGTCAAFFWPDAVRSADEANRWLLLWNGEAFKEMGEEGPDRSGTPMRG